MTDLIDLEVIREHMKQYGGYFFIDPPLVNPVEFLSQTGIIYVFKLNLPHTRIIEEACKTSLFNNVNK